jgi:hypothetical protein
LASADPALAVPQTGNSSKRPEATVSTMTVRKIAAPFTYTAEFAPFVPLTPGADVGSEIDAFVAPGLSASDSYNPVPWPGCLTKKLSFP